jgi:hypothetical protein
MLKFYKKMKTIQIKLRQSFKLSYKASIYFYKLETVGVHSRPQANIKADADSLVELSASINKLWIEKLNAVFVSGWLREYGERITWAKHNMMRLDFDSKKLVIQHYGEKANFSNKSLPIEFSSAALGTAVSVNVLSKDLLPVLSGLADVEMKGKVSLSVAKDCIAFAYETEIATYKVFVPTCSVSGKRSKSAFEAYGS